MDKKPLTGEALEKANALNAALTDLQKELTNYIECGFKAAGRRTRSALTTVTQTGKPFRAASLAADDTE